MFSGGIERDQLDEMVKDLIFKLVIGPNKMAKQNITQFIVYCKCTYMSLL